MGRPSKPDALTPAERMRAYRLRKKDGRVTEKNRADRVQRSRTVTEILDADRFRSVGSVTFIRSVGEWTPTCRSWFWCPEFPDVWGPYDEIVIVVGE